MWICSTSLGVGGGLCSSGVVLLIEVHNRYVGMQYFTGGWRGGGGNDTLELCKQTFFLS